MELTLTLRMLPATPLYTSVLASTRYKFEQSVYHFSISFLFSEGSKRLFNWLRLRNLKPFSQLDCARMLLYRGIDKSIKNKAGQTASEVALLSGNEEVMNNIKMFSSKSVG